MLKQFKSALIFSALFLFLCLGGWCWFQSSRISSLEAENQAQAQTISQYAAEIDRTLKTLEEERKAVETLAAMEAEQNERANDDVKQIKTTLATQDCSRVLLPSGVVKRLQ